MTRITRGMLVDLGVCGTYLNRFDREFPNGDYPNGTEINRGVCEDKYSVFDWDWAASVMLTSDGARQWRNNTSVDNDEGQRLRDERQAIREERGTAIREWQTKFNQSQDYPEYTTSQEARDEYNRFTTEFEQRLEVIEERVSRSSAGAFGQLMENPGNYSNAFQQALLAEQRRFAEQQRRAVTDAQSTLNDAKERIRTAEVTIEDAKRRTTNARRRIAEWTARLPELEAALVQAKADFARRELVRQEEAVAAEQAKLEALRQQIADADAAKAAEAAEVPVEANAEATS